MFPFFLYLLRVSLSLALIFVLYRLVIQQLPRLTWNRNILLVGLIISFLLPISQYTISVTPPESMAGWLDLDGPLPTTNLEAPSSQAELMVGPGSISPDPKSNADFPWSAFFLLVYLLGMAWKSFPWLNGLWQIHRLARNHMRERVESVYLYRLPFAFSPCSHFSHVFVGEEFEELPQRSQEAILAHEAAHVKLKHSWDILLVEGAQIILWFNPLLKKYREMLQEVHEYQADEAATQQHSKKEYARLLVALSQRQMESRFGHGFARSLLKARISHLLSAPKRPLWHYLTLLLIAPMLVLTSCTQWEPEPTVVEVASVPHFPPPPPPSDLPSEGDSSRFIPSIPPVGGEVTAEFGMGTHPITKERRFHRGRDFRADLGTPILATADGVVAKVPDPQPGGFGVHVYIRHGDLYETHYAHLKEVLVSEGDVVKRADVIAYSGNSGLSTGPHLHYEVKDLKRTDAETPFVNPALFMPEVEAAGHEHH